MRDAAGGATRRAALAALLASLLPAVAAAQHACELDPRSDECAAACTSGTPAEACAQVCLNDAAVSWCPGYCEAHPDRSCLPQYRALPPCPAYSGLMWRVSLRGALGAQLRDAPGAFLGAQVQLGARVSSEVSLVAKLRAAPVGLDANVDWILSAGAELGAEWMIFDAIATQTALALSASAGLWLPNYCREGTECPFALPMVSVGIEHVMFGRSPDPYYSPYQGISVGLEGGVGYDPWLSEVIGRVSLVLGLELAFH